MFFRYIKYIVAAMTVLLMASCATLTESQLKMVTNLMVASDSVAIESAVIFEELAVIRIERGLYYAASLTLAEARGKEMKVKTADLNAQAKIIRTKVTNMNRVPKVLD